MYPTVIQGGMGIGVSHWKLAKAVSMCGQLGVISGTAIDTLLIRRLQDGDEGGHLRRALSFFPDQQGVADVIAKYFLPEGRAPGKPYKLLPLYQKVSNKARDFISVLGAFAEVFLAKEGHAGVVGMNLLTKIQPPTISTIYGALLAGVDYLLVGAGIPREIPQVLSDLIDHKEASIRLEVEGGSGEDRITFDPAVHFVNPPHQLEKPIFLPIVSSHTLATMLAKKLKDGVDGFVVEGAVAGGHNAPPRDNVLSEAGEPIYGPRDEADLEKIKELGKPFWLAGSTGNKKALDAALEHGACGVQVGTLFAFSSESGIAPDLRLSVMEKASSGTVEVFTDPKASPTGFPFKVIRIEGTVSEDEVYHQRPRICDIGLLRAAYRKEDGSIGFRCPGEPVSEFIKKGGDVVETEGRKCICNGLFSTVGLSQIQRDGYQEPSIVTAGNEFADVKELSIRKNGEYTAKDAVEFILGV